MNPRHAATIALQRPAHPRPSASATPLPLPPVARDVCPTCKRETVVHGFRSPDGHRVETHCCPEHGDVVPMRSAVANSVLPGAVWDGEGP